MTKLGVLVHRALQEPVSGPATRAFEMECGPSRIERLLAVLEAAREVIEAIDDGELLGYSEGSDQVLSALRAALHPCDADPLLAPLANKVERG